MSAVVSRGSQEMVASIIRTVFSQPDAEHIQEQFAEVTTMLAPSHPKVAAMLPDAEADLLSFSAFPHWRWHQIWSTNSLERANKGIKRRTVGAFPNPAALLRLSGSVLIEQHDEWEAAERRYFSEASMLELTTMNNPIEVLNEAVMLPELAAA
jgi:transposase-like protein